MLRLLADENFNNHVLHGLRRLLPEIDLTRVQDLALMERHDPAVLEWAAENGLILVSHDQRTVPRYAHDRVRRGLLMTGVIIVPGGLSRRTAIEDLALIAYCYGPEEMVNNVVYLPL
jgi:hypothetical protein